MRKRRFGGAGQGVAQVREQFRRGYRRIHSACRRRAGHRSRTGRSLRGALVRRPGIPRLLGRLVHRLLRGEAEARRALKEFDRARFPFRTEKAAPVFSAAAWMAEPISRSSARRKRMRRPARRPDCRAGNGSGCGARRRAAFRRRVSSAGCPGRRSPFSAGSEPGAAQRRMDGIGGDSFAEKIH